MCLHLIINPQLAAKARVTVLGLCVCVCVCVCNNFIYGCGSRCGYWATIYTFTHKQAASIGGDCKVFQVPRGGVPWCRCTHSGHILNSSSPLWLVGQKEVFVLCKPFCIEQASDVVWTLLLIHCPVKFEDKPNVTINNTPDSCL